MKNIINSYKNISETDREFLTTLVDIDEKIHPMYLRQLLKIIQKLDKMLSPPKRSGRKKTPLKIDGDAD